MSCQRCGRKISDGDNDVVCGNSRDLALGFPPPQNRLYLNDGAGSFVDVTTTQLPTDNDDTLAVALADAEHDERLHDVVARDDGRAVGARDAAGRPRHHRRPLVQVRRRLRPARPGQGPGRQVPAAATGLRG